MNWLAVSGLGMSIEGLLFGVGSFEVAEGSEFLSFKAWGSLRLGVVYGLVLFMVWGVGVALGLLFLTLFRVCGFVWSCLDFFGFGFAACGRFGCGLGRGCEQVQGL